MAIEHDTARLLLGAYVLGSLNDSDRRTVSAHLGQCGECRQELALYAPLPGLLRRVAAPATTRAKSPHAVLDRLLSKAQRARRVRRGYLMAAGAVVLAVTLGAGLFLIRPDPGVPASLSMTFAAADGHVTGRAVLTGKPWGTAVAMSLTGVTATGPCRLEVTGAGGQTEQAATWGPPPDGRAEIIGASSLAPLEVRELTIVDQEDRVLARARVD